MPNLTGQSIGCSRSVFRKKCALILGVAVFITGFGAGCARQTPAELPATTAIATATLTRFTATIVPPSVTPEPSLTITPTQTLAGDRITARQTRAPGNGASIGGLKVTTANGWFAARPSRTEEIYKIYAESFVDADHLNRLVDEAQAMVSEAFKAAGA